MSEKANPEPEKKRRKPAPDSWISIRRTLRTWEQPRLLGLVQDLFKTVPEARAAIVGRLLMDQPAQARRATLDELRKRVHKTIRPSRNFWKCNPDMRGARRICDQYLRSSFDIDGAIALYVEMVQSAMELAFDYCWDETSFYDSIARAAYAAQELVPGASDADLMQELADRVARLLENKNFPGWGMDEVIESFAMTLSEQASAIKGAESC
jgi:hypothetical protein